jgi:hypothetical protein
MGTHPAPSYANIYMAKRIDENMRNLSSKYDENGTATLKMFKRFLDDIFQIFIGSTKQLHQLFNEINQIHPSIKFTMSHTTTSEETNEEKCDCPETNGIPFLDTYCSLKEGRIDIDLYRKKTDRNQYLLPQSCHPKSTTANIPFSLALRIIRICTSPENRDKRLNEMKQRLLSRGYSGRPIDAAITKAKKIPRKIALKRAQKKDQSKRPIFAVKFDPRLPSIPSITAKHWRSMTSQDQYLAEVFPQPPLTAFRSQTTIRNLVIKAKVPDAP